MEGLSVEDFMRTSVQDGEKLSKKRKRKQSSETPKKILHKNSNNEKKKSSKVKSHKFGLAQLETYDPEFFQFLKEQDADLLDFDLSSDEDSNQDEDEYLHKPPEKLQVASDDEDYDSSDQEQSSKDIQVQTKDIQVQEEVSKRVGGNVTLKMVKNWEDSLNKSPSFALVREIVQAFRGALAKSGADVEGGAYHVPDSTVFNAIIRLCFTEFLTALRRLFDIDELDGGTKAADVKRKAKWVKYKPDLKMYLKDVVLLLAQIQESDLICSVIKQVQQLIPFFYAFPKLTKYALKSLITVWSRKDENCRVASLVCIIKIMQKSDEYFTIGLKTLYISYVNNAKLVTQDTWPALNFMQRSFGEVVALNPDLTYEYAFVYIRQMAIHLRNAMTAKRKDLLSVVYNWQYVMCLYLWCRTLSKLYTHHLMQQLIHPLTQIIFACARLISSAKYLPLRFHCVRALLKLLENTNLYCPVLGIVTETLTDHLPFLNKKRARQSNKPYILDCVLKVSKGQLLENAYPDAVVDTAIELILRCSHNYVGHITFPEMIVSARERVRNFCKECKIGNYSRQVRALFEKLTEHAKYIEARRSATKINLADKKSVERFENRLKQDEETSPLGKYFSSWKILHEQDIMKKIYRKDEIVDLDVRKVPREDQKEKMRKMEEKKRTGVSKSFEEIMQQSDESDSDNESRFNPNKNTRGQQKPALKFDYSDDDVTSDDASADEPPPLKKRIKKPKHMKSKSETAEMVELMTQEGEEDKVTELDISLFDEC